MDSELRGMVMSYRVTELQALLAFAGKNKQGRKNELQARALELVRARTPQVVMKMKELYRSLQSTHYGQPLSLTASTLAGGGATASMASSRYEGSGGYYTGGNYKQGQESAFGRSTLQSIGYQRVVSIDGQYRQVPICPDVKMKELPFYDIHSVLIRPTTLINQGQMPKQETQNSFCLTPSQAAEIARSKEIVPADGVITSRMQFNTQVQLRFCALDSTEEQDDQFPQSLIVKVNGRNIQLPHPIPSNRPGVEPKRPSKPLNVTNSVKCSPTVTNIITVQWVADATKNFAMSVYIVKRLTAEELFLRLKNKRIQPADFTRGRIKEITSSEEEDLCAPTSIRVSVACPLGKNRMAYPCRATTCKHLQCFDANLFLLMNEKKPTFICPVCNKPLKFEHLSIDGYFMDVIKELSIDAGNDIELYPDGRWEPAIKVKNEIEDVGPPPKRLKTDNGSGGSGASTSLNATIDLDDDILVVEDEAPAASTQNASTSSKSSSSKKAEPEIIDLLSSDEEEDDKETTRASGGSETASMTPTLDEFMPSMPAPHTSVEADDDSDNEIGIRPRRRAKKVNYIEDSDSDSSTTNDGTTTVVQTASAPRRARSPACIELSDSAPSSPEGRQPPPARAFAAVSGQQSSSRSSSTSSSAAPNNNRSGSGSSTLYSSSTTATATSVPATGIGLPSSPMDTTMSMSPSPHNYNMLSPSPSTFSYSATSTQSASLYNNPPVPSTLPSSPLYYSSTSTTSGYTAYDARSGWDAELNSLINLQAGYGQMNLAAYDYLNPSAHQQHPSNYSGFGPRPPRGAGPGGGYGGWM